MRMKWIWTIATICLAGSAMAQVNVEDFRKASDGNDDAVFINRAMQYMDSIGHGRLDFDGTKTYTIKSAIQLPQQSKGDRRLFIIEGNGAKVVGSANVNVFSRVPDSQTTANRWMSTRFVIRNFSFVGGKRAIFLCASYGSLIENCNFNGQKEAGVEVQFGLQTKISNCNATNLERHNYVLTYGKAWEAGINNSQSNHSIIEHSRVFARDGALTAFKIEGSDGCVLRDVISEGSKEIKYSVMFNKRHATTVKMFRIENFHLEHAPKEAAIFLHGDGVMVIDGLFYQLSRKEWPLVHVFGGSGQVTLENIPWYVGGTVLKQEVEGGVAWRVESCHKKFYEQSIYRVQSKDKKWSTKYPNYFYGVGGMKQVGKVFGKQLKNR